MGKDKGLESLSDSSAEDITAYLIALQNKTLSYKTKPLILLTAERNMNEYLSANRSVQAA